jgi:hypothetical protein
MPSSHLQRAEVAEVRGKWRGKRRKEGERKKKKTRSVE